MSNEKKAKNTYGYLWFNITIVVLFILTAIAFAIIYFLQTKSVSAQLDKVIENQINTINIQTQIIQTNGMTNTIDNESITKLEKSIENILISQGTYTREYINQIIKNSTDLTSFWLAFLSVFMVVFTLFSIVTNNNILKKSEEELRKVKRKSNKIIKELLDTKEKVEASEKKTNAISLFNQGGRAYTEKKYEEAIKYYSESIKLNPNDSISYNNRGVAYTKLEKYDEAIKDYNEALKLNPNFSNAYVGIGFTYDRLKQYDKAIENYSKAIELNPNSSEAYNNRGFAHYKTGEKIKQNKNSTDTENYYNKAMDDFNRAAFDIVSKDKESMDIIKDLAKNKNAKAIEFCNKNNIDIG